MPSVTSRQAIRPTAAALVDLLGRAVRMIEEQRDGATPGDRASFRALRSQVLATARAIPPLDHWQASEAVGIADELVDIAVDAWGSIWGTGEFAGLLAAIGVALERGLDCHAIRDPGLRSEWRALIRAHGRFLARLAAGATEDDLEHGRQTGAALAAMLFDGAFLIIEDEPAAVARAA